MSSFLSQSLFLSRTMTHSGKVAYTYLGVGPLRQVTEQPFEP